MTYPEEGALTSENNIGTNRKDDFAGIHRRWKQALLHGNVIASQRG
jgi:hypothetical protein